MVLIFVGFFAILSVAIFIYWLLLNRRLGILGFIAGLGMIIGSWWLSLLWLGHASAQCQLDPTAICEYAGGIILFSIIAITIVILYLIIVSLFAFLHFHKRQHNPLPRSQDW